MNHISAFCFSYKPVDHKLIWLPLREAFEELFVQTFSKKQNFTFLGHIQTCYRQKRWQDLLKLMQHVYKSAVNKAGAESEPGRWQPRLPVGGHGWSLASRIRRSLGQNDAKLGIAET